MCRRNREFSTEYSELEGRMLLAVVPASTPVSSPPVQVQFENTTGTLGYNPVQLVTQQAGEATVTLSRSNTVGSLQVRVVTDSYASTNVVGVNVGAVDQIVTFANGQSQATVKVSIIAGAPNPGEVDVNVDVSPAGPSTNGNSPTFINYPFALDLRVVASDPKLPPKIVSKFSGPRGIVLSFNKPMNPVGASNANNYSVNVMTIDHHNIAGGLGTFFGAARTTLIGKSVPLKAARYDPVTQSVTLVLKNEHQFAALGLADGGLPMTEVHPAVGPVRPGHPLKVVGSLTDAEGNPINADTTPGKVKLLLKAYQDNTRNFL